MQPLLPSCALGNISVDVAQAESRLFLLVMLLTGTNRKQEDFLHCILTLC